MRFWVWIGGRTRRRLANKKEVAHLANWARKSRLGEFLLCVWCGCDLLLIESWCMRGWVYNLHENQRWNWVSRIFPETAWRVTRDRQATQTPDPISGYQRWTTWRQRMNCQVARTQLHCFLAIFDIFGVLVMWPWCLYARMWILMFDRLCLCWLCCKTWILIWNWVLGLCWELDRIQFDWWILSLREWMLFKRNRECGCVRICKTWVVWIIDNCLESWDFLSFVYGVI